MLVVFRKKANVFSYIFLSLTLVATFYFDLIKK